MASNKINYSSIESILSNEDIKLMKLKAKKPFTYDTTSHLKVIFGVYASIWPRTIPFSLFYMALAYLFYFLKDNIVDLSVDSTGVKYISTLVSFYLISATSIVLDRYAKSAAHLFGLTENVAGLAQSVVLFNQDKSHSAMQWRFDVFYQILNLNISTLGALRYKTSGVNVWEYEDLPPGERKYIKDNVLIPSETCQRHKKKNFWFAGKTRTMLDENFRAPFLMATKLRHVIIDWRTRIYKNEFSEDNEDFEYLRKAVTFMLPMSKDKFENKLEEEAKEEADKKKFPVHIDLLLLQYVSNFLKHFIALKCTEGTPIPFPFVKMRKIILFFWLLLLPLAFLSDSSFSLIPLLLLTGIISTGFVGLEIVIMELVEPFGADIYDLNDVNLFKNSTTIILDALAEIDGDKAATKLQQEFSCYCDKKK